jgi:tetratricopeptide (TPR) repeat protein
VGSAVRPGGSSSPADDRNPSAGSTPGTLPCDLALSRRFGNPGASVPDPDEVADELSLLFSLSCRYAVALYPAGAGTRIGQIASGLWRPFTLEGFVPHRFTETFHDRGESSGGDLYIFALEGEPLPLPFTAPGGRHARRSPCGSPSGNPEDPEMLLQAVKELASRGETGKAVPLLSRLARMRPEDTRLRLNLGYFLLNIGSLLPAAEAFRSALADEPDNGEARRALAGIFLHLRDWAGLRPFLPELMILRTSSPRVAEIWPEIRKGFIELERGA